MYKQLIIARRDLNMSPGKLAAQVSHASMAFLTAQIKENAEKICLNGSPVMEAHGQIQWAKEAHIKGETLFCHEPIDSHRPNGPHRLCEPKFMYFGIFRFDPDLYEQWILGSFTKVVRRP